MQVQFGLSKGLVGYVLQVLLGEAPQADETRITDQHRRKTVDLRFPYDRPWRQGFPYVFGIVTGVGGRCRLVGKQVFSDTYSPY